MKRFRVSAAPVLFGTLGFVLLLGLWQWGSTQVSTESALPSVPAVAVALGTNFALASFWVSVVQTLGIALLGWLIAAAIGVTLGIFVGRSPAFAAATRGIFDFLRPVPAIVILPLAMLVLGPTTQMGVFLVIFGIVLPITAQIAAGVESVDPVAISTARSFGMSEAEILWRVVLPGTSPYIGTAMRIAAPVTLIMTVVAGMLGGAPGLGNSLTVAQVAGRYVDLFAYVLVLGVLGYLVQLSAAQIERKTLHWHSAYRKVI